MLNQAIAKANLSQCLCPAEAFQPFPRYEDRAGWQALAPEIQSYFAGLSANLQGCSWPELPASLYMDYVRNGNRSRFETPHFQRRRQLLTLLIAECIEGDGRLVDDIINGLWAICEESTWVVPAHNISVVKPGSGILLDILAKPHVLDLFAAETGSLLSWVVALMGNRLDLETPLITQRVRYEVDQRLFIPYLERDDFRWMGLAHDDPVNNWNPWINSNVLAAALNLEPNAQRRCQLVEKIGRSTQRFLAFYAPDGGCDEGPSYFNVAGGSLMDVLFLLDEGTRGAVDIYGEALIQNMSKFIVHTHIHGKWHVNFADAHAQLQPDAMLLWRVGEKTKQPDLVAYAKYALAAGFASSPYQVANYTVYRRLCNLFQYDPQAFQNAPPLETRENYFPGIQVMTARSQANSAQGLFLAAKGGHNGESHNHNDIGNYIIALDGEPLIVDAGVGVYTKFTFNEMRYTLPFMCSPYHNTAILNNAHQLPGSEHCAKDVSYQATAQDIHFALDMAPAYAPEAQIQRYHRSFHFNRPSDQITLEDQIDFTAQAQALTLPLMSSVEPTLTEGTLLFPGQSRTLRLDFDPSAFTAQVEAIELGDANLLRDWQRPTLYRTLLTRKESAQRETIQLRYSVEG